jgi:pseudaminic acid cytidylyltransferase
MANKPLRAIAVIPARGGSKRLPRKALLPFNGKPIIAHTIDAAHASGRFEKIVISSDDDEILAIATQFGGVPYRRDQDLSGDSAPTAPVLLDVLAYEEAHGEEWDILACLYATAPLRTSHDISAVLDLIEPGACDFAMAVCESGRPVHQALVEKPDGSLEAVWPDKVGLNSEHVPKYFFGNGSTYAVTVSAFKQIKSLYGPGLRGHIMPKSRSVDLNTQEDLALLTFYAEQLKTD